MSPGDSRWGERRVKASTAGRSCVFRASDKLLSGERKHRFRYDTTTRQRNRHCCQFHSCCQRALSTCSCAYPPNKAVSLHSVSFLQIKMPIPKRVQFALPQRRSQDTDMRLLDMAGLFGGGAPAASSSAAATQGDISKDMAVSEPPTDSISALRFSPQAEFLAVSSWDKKVRIYEIANNGSTTGKAYFDHEGPVLNCCWSAVRQTFHSFREKRTILRA